MRAPRLVVGVLVSLMAAGGSMSSASAQAPKAPPKAAPRPAPKPVPKPAPKAPAPAPAPQPPPPPPPDLVVTMRHLSGDKTSGTTVSMKGRRQRIDYGPDMAVLQQCDLDRMYQVNDQNRRYLAVAPAQEPDAAARKKGGVVTYTTTIVDTGERKEIFGITARHLKTVLTKTSTPEACDGRPEQVETDGWFIDTPAMGCPAAGRPAVARTPEGCEDAVTYVDPPGPPAGYPLAYEMSTTPAGGAPRTMRMEVVEFVKTTLPGSLFEVPVDYTEVPNLMQFSAPADGSKRAGVVRVCASTVTAKADPGVSLDDLTDALVVSLGDSGLDAQRLAAQTPDEERAEAQSRACDYVLTTAVTEVRKPGTGMLSRVSGTASTFGAKVDYRLAAPGSKSPQVASSERSGGSTLKTAIGAAKTISRYVTPLGMLSSSYSAMGAMTAVSGGASTPGMQQGSDPVVNTVFYLVDRATGNKPEPELVNEAAAVASAMLKQVAAIATFVAKAPR